MNADRPLIWYSCRHTFSLLLEQLNFDDESLQFFGFSWIDP